MTKGKFLQETDSAHVNFASLSHTGKVRQNNEDRLAVHCYITSEPLPRYVLLSVLSDGVGGNRAGEVAAQIGVDTITELAGNLNTLEDPAAALKEIMIAANKAVLNAGAERNELKGMGATCICALLVEKTLYLASLGDSRAYLLRGQMIRQLNYDHTWLEEKIGMSLTNSKSITRSHQLAHVLSRYLGSAHPAPVDLRIQSIKNKIFQKGFVSTEKLDLFKGDHILLCSDGLTDMLTDGEIKAVIKGEALQNDVQLLVQHALEKGGHDNVSVILMKVL